VIREPRGARQSHDFAVAAKRRAARGRECRAAPEL